MTEVPFLRVKEVLGVVRHLAGAERAARIRAECDGDSALQAEVESLLAEEAAASAHLAPELAGIRQVLEAALPRQLPESIGRYRVIRRIATGGMGAVFEAEQEQPRRRVALKMIRAGFASEDLVRRFRLESEILGRLRHPGIAQIYEASTVDVGDGPQPFFAMEYVEGVTLTQHVRDNRVGLEGKLSLFARICDAVHHAHQKGVIHRDLKPDNILVTVPHSDGTTAAASKRSVEPKILDFGVARVVAEDQQAATALTLPGQMIGTLPYMSPEQVAGDVDAMGTGCDVYALGVVLYELLTGRLPHEVDGLAIPEAARVIRETDARSISRVDPALRGDLDTIVGKAIERDHERRYHSAAELADDTRRFLAHAPITARPPSSFYVARKFARRHRALVGGAASTVVVLVAGIFAATMQAMRANKNAASSARHAYHASIDAAASRLGADPSGAAASLARAPESLRGWEWRYLSSRLDPLRCAYECDVGGDSTRCTDVAFTPTGTLLLAAPSRSTPGELRVVEAASGEVRLRARLEGEVEALRLSRDGRRLAVLASDPHSVSVWAVDEAESAIPIGPLSIRSLPGRPAELLFSDDGRFVAGNCVVRQGPRESQELALLDVDRDAEVWSSRDTHLGAAVGTREDEFVLTGWSDTDPAGLFLLGAGGRASLGDLGLAVAAALSVDATHLAICCLKDGIPALDVFDAQSKLSEHHITDIPGTVDWIEFDDAGRWIAGALLGREVQLWDLTTGKKRMAIPGEVGGLAFHPQGSLIAASTRTGAKVWEIRASDTPVLQHGGYVYQAVFSPDGDLLATGGSDGQVRLFDALTGQQLGSLEIPWPEVHGLSFTVDGLGLVASFKNQTRLWRLTSGAASAQDLPAVEGDQDEPGYARQRPFWRHARPGAASVLWLHTNCLCTSDDGSIFAHGTRDGFGLFDMESGRLLTENRALDDSPRASRAIAISQEHELVVIATGTGIAVRELRSQREVKQLRGHQADVMTLDFSPDGERIASGGRDGTVRIWRLEEEAPLLTLRGHAGYVHSVEFSPDGSQIASASGDGTVRIWDSMSRGARWLQVSANRALRRALAPRVDALLADHGDAASALATARDSGHFSDVERAAVQRILIERALADD